MTSPVQHGSGRTLKTYQFIRGAEDMPSIFVCVNVVKTYSAFFCSAGTFLSLKKNPYMLSGTRKPLWQTVHLCKREQDTSLCLFRLSRCLIFNSRNNRYEGAPSVFSVQTLLYTTSKLESEPRTTLLHPTHTHDQHLLSPNHL